MTEFIARLAKPLLSGLAALLLVSGCASTNNPRDPFEPLNRGLYQVNDVLDRAVMKPVASVYKTVIPELVRTGVTNFFSNLYDILTALNNLLQGKFADALSDTGRVVLNSTAGLLGLIDLGTEVGLEKHKEDFGQTLGWWGAPAGPYLQIPFFGPSSIRDAVGSFVDFKVDPIKWIWRNDMPTRNSLWGLYFVNLRANLLDSTKILDEAALDPYEFQRDAYLQRRRNLVYDGNPPKEKDDEDIPDVKVKPRSDADEPAKQSTGDAADPAPAAEAVLQPRAEIAPAMKEAEPPFPQI